MEGSHGLGPVSDLLHDMLELNVRFQLDRLLIRESLETKGLRDVGFWQFGRFAVHHDLQPCLVTFAAFLFHGSHFSWAGIAFSMWATSCTMVDGSRLKMLR